MTLFVYQSNQIGKYPFDIMSNAPQASDKFDEAVCLGLRPTLPDDCPPKLRSLMEDCWRHDPNMRPTVDQIIARLKEIPRLADEDAADIIEDLQAFPKAIALFEEQKRRIAELEGEMKSNMRKLRTCENAASEEKRAREKLQTKYDKLKQKQKDTKAEQAHALEDLLQRTTELEQQLEKAMERERKATRSSSKSSSSSSSSSHRKPSAAATTDGDESSDDEHKHRASDSSDNDEEEEDHSDGSDDEEEEDEEEASSTEDSPKKPTKKKQMAPKRSAAPKVKKGKKKSTAIDDDDVEIISSELARLQLLHAGGKGSSQQNGSKASTTSTTVDDDEPVGVRTRRRSPSPAVSKTSSTTIDLRTPPK
jgi:hypothetical protein